MKKPSEKISKYRYRLLDYIVANDTVAAKETFYFLIHTLEDSNNLAFYWHEKIMLSFLFDEYKFILSEIYNLDSITINSMRNKIYPMNDQLYFILLKKIRDKSSIMLDKIQKNKVLTAEERDFLILLLSIYSNEITYEYMNKLNKNADIFLNEYPNSLYSNYVRYNIRHRYKMKSYFLTSMGFGLSYFSGNISEYFTNDRTLCINIGYGESNAFRINFEAFFSFPNLKKDIVIKEKYFTPDSTFIIDNVSLIYYYDKLKIKRWGISPFVGVGFQEVGHSPSHSQDNSNVHVTAFAFPSIGLEGLLHIFKNDRISADLGLSSNYTLSFRYTFIPFYFNKEHSFLNGSYHTLVVMFTIKIGNVVRDY